MLKTYQKMLWGVLLFQTLFLAFLFLNSQIKDETLAKGKIDDFNRGWVLIREDGKRESIDQLPYKAKSNAYETVILENKIPKEYAGQTLSFLSADKTLKVSVDGKVIYEFGTMDKRIFGHTPGSLVNFIDIPNKLDAGIIQIEMISPYKNYATNNYFYLFHKKSTPKNIFNYF